MSNIILGILFLAACISIPTLFMEPEENPRIYGFCVAAIFWFVYFKFEKNK